jgi:hypothetical protein
MCKTDTEYLEGLRKHAIEARTFLVGHKTKEERERSVCRAFLRTIGITFEEFELKAPAPSGEPADVDFRVARFQVRDLLDGRKRGDEWKGREKKYSKANSLDELLEPYSPPTSIELQELVPKIAQALSEKAQRYGTGCDDIDALVYVDIEDQYLAEHSVMPDLNVLRSQGWRSVSLIFSPYGVILFAKSTAPDFLRALEPGQYMKYEDICSLFEPA